MTNHTSLWRQTRSSWIQTHILSTLDITARHVRKHLTKIHNRFYFNKLTAALSLTEILHCHRCLMWNAFWEWDLFRWSGLDLNESEAESQHQLSMCHDLLPESFLFCCFCCKFAFSLVFRMSFPFLVWNYWFDLSCVSSVVWFLCISGFSAHVRLIYILFCHSIIFMVSDNSIKTKFSRCVCDEGCGKETIKIYATVPYEGVSIRLMMSSEMVYSL